MDGNREQELKMAALCRRLGHLWTGRKIAVLDNVVIEEKLQECKHIIFGRLHGSPSVNFQAFQARCFWLEVHHFSTAKFLP